MSQYGTWKAAHQAQQWAMWHRAQRASGHRAIWTVFVGEEGVPPEVRVGWLTEPRDEERLHTAVVHSLTRVARTGLLDEGDRALRSCLHVNIDARWRGSSHQHTGPAGSPARPADAVAMLALTHLGEDPSGLIPTAIHRARVVAGHLEAETTIHEPSLPPAGVRRGFADRLSEALAREPLDDGHPQSLALMRHADGVITVGLVYPEATAADAGPADRGPAEGLAARALADLRG